MVLSSSGRVACHGGLLMVQHNSISLNQPVRTENPIDEILYVHRRAFWTRRSFIAVLYAENLMLFRSANGGRDRKRLE